MAKKKTPIHKLLAKSLDDKNPSEEVQKIIQEIPNAEAKIHGALSEGAIRQKVAAFSDEIIATLIRHMRSKNDNASLGAANTLSKKILPDLKSVELVGELQSDGTRRPIELFVNVGGGFIPAAVSVSTSSAGGIAKESSEIQDNVNIEEEKKDA